MQRCPWCEGFDLYRDYHDTERGVPLQDAPDLPAAVQQAREMAHPGDAVLMSPACASFDMFKHYEHRAEVFRQAVAALAEQAGVSLGGAR